jgi:hypothetical protein
VAVGLGVPVDVGLGVIVGRAVGAVWAVAVDWIVAVGSSSSDLPEEQEATSAINVTARRRVVAVRKGLFTDG